MGKRPKNTSKTKCDWQTLTAPPHRRGKLKYHSPSRCDGTMRQSKSCASGGGGPRSGGGGDMKQGGDVHEKILQMNIIFDKLRHD